MKIKNGFTYSLQNEHGKFYRRNCRSSKRWQDKEMIYSPETIRSAIGMMHNNDKIKLTVRRYEGTPKPVEEGLYEITV